MCNGRKESIIPRNLRYFGCAVINTSFVACVLLGIVAGVLVQQFLWQLLGRFHRGLLQKTMPPKATFAEGPGRCPRCTERVYQAEEIICAGAKWHKKCFNCQMCRKKLDSTTCNTHKAEIFCKGCYGKNYGPKGYGYGVGAGALTNTGK